MLSCSPLLQHRYEQQISVYKVKLGEWCVVCWDEGGDRWIGNKFCPFPLVEDVHELRKQIRSLEEKNAVYMQQNLDLEEELRRTSSVKVQLNSHKQRV